MGESWLFGSVTHVGHPTPISMRVIATWSLSRCPTLSQTETDQPSSMSGTYEIMSQNTHLASLPHFLWFRAMRQDLI